MALRPVHINGLSVTSKKLFPKNLVRTSNAFFNQGDLRDQGCVKGCQSRDVQLHSYFITRPGAGQSQIKTRVGQGSPVNFNAVNLQVIAFKADVQSAVHNGKRGLRNTEE